MKVAILIPTYNEEKNIGLLLTAINQVAEALEDTHLSVYVIDDSSPDGTGDAVLRFEKGIKAKNLKIGLLTREKKEGLGKAYVYGFNVVSNLEYPPHYILQMDSDLSHNPIYIHDFIVAAQMGADFIVGSRYIEGGSSPDWSWYRKALSRGGNAFARAMLGPELTDYTGGFNMFSL